MFYVNFETVLFYAIIVVSEPQVEQKANSIPSHREFDENAPDFNLAQIIALDFQAFSEEIQDISNAATQELNIKTRT